MASRHAPGAARIPPSNGRQRGQPRTVARGAVKQQPVRRLVRRATYLQDLTSLVAHRWQRAQFAVRY